MVARQSFTNKKDAERFCASVTAATEISSGYLFSGGELPQRIRIYFVTLNEKGDLLGESWETQWLPQKIIDDMVPLVTAPQGHSFWAVAAEYHDPEIAIEAARDKLRQMKEG
jgi:hypothetical protein